MSKATRKKVITIETFQRTVIRHNAPQTQKMWCDFCQAEVEMVSPELAATNSGLSVREIYRRIEQGGLHFFETDTDGILICKHSLKPNQRGENLV